MVERKLPKLDIAGSIPVSRSIKKALHPFGCKAFLFLVPFQPLRMRSVSRAMASSSLVGITRTLTRPVLISKALS